VGYDAINHLILELGRNYPLMIQINL